MNIDMAALHAIETDKGISVDVVVETIKSALLTAYRHTEGHEADARIDVDRKSGVVKVIARETDDDAISSTNGTTPPQRDSGVSRRPPRAR